MNTETKQPGLKESELRTLTTCKVCGLKIGKLTLPIFWKIQAERHALDIKAVHRQQGLGMMLGGNGYLAEAMGTNEDLTAKLSSDTVMICDQCVIRRLPELLQD